MKRSAESSEVAFLKKSKTIRTLADVEAEIIQGQYENEKRELDLLFEKTEGCELNNSFFKNLNIPVLLEYSSYKLQNSHITIISICNIHNLDELALKNFFYILQRTKIKLLYILNSLSENSFSYLADITPNTSLIEVIYWGAEITLFSNLLDDDKRLQTALNKNEKRLKQLHQYKCATYNLFYLMRFSVLKSSYSPFIGLLNLPYEIIQHIAKMIFSDSGKEQRDIDSLCDRLEILALKEKAPLKEWNILLAEVNQHKFDSFREALQGHTEELEFMHGSLTVLCHELKLHVTCDLIPKLLLALEDTHIETLNLTSTNISEDDLCSILLDKSTELKFINLKSPVGIQCLIQPNLIMKVKNRETLIEEYVNRIKTSYNI